MALDELLDGDLGAVVDAAAGDGLVQLVGAVDPFGPDAPAPAAGLSTSGYPTSAANRRTSSPERAAVDAAQRTPASRSTSFIAGLSRHRNAVRSDVPGMPHASRTRAAAMMWASTVASRRSTQTCRWSRRTTSYSWPSSTTEPTCS